MSEVTQVDLDRDLAGARAQYLSKKMRVRLIGGPRPGETKVIDVATGNAIPCVQSLKLDLDPQQARALITIAVDVEFGGQVHG